jgi:hypothetical protein
VKLSKIERIFVAAVIEDQFGSEWSKCLRLDCTLEVVRPGKVQCDGESDRIGCPYGVQDLIDGLYAENDYLESLVERVYRLAVGHSWDSDVFTSVEDALKAYEAKR